MSATFGYADDYKIVGDNPLTLNIDVRRLWRWCEEKCMSMNLTKKKVLCIEGSATIALPSYSFETTGHPDNRHALLDATHEKEG